MTEYTTSGGETWLCPPWAITPTARITTRECRSCGARVAWLKTRKTRESLSSLFIGVVGILLVAFALLVVLPVAK